MDLNYEISTRSVFGKQLVPFLIDFGLNIYLIVLDLTLSPISFEFIAWWQAMLVLASVSTVRTVPVPPIFVLFYSIKEMFADNI